MAQNGIAISDVNSAEPMDVDPDEAIVPYVGRSVSDVRLTAEQSTRTAMNRARARRRLERTRARRQSAWETSGSYADIPENFRQRYILPPGSRYSSQVVSFERMASDWYNLHADSRLLARVDEDVDMGVGSPNTVYGIREDGKMRRLNSELAVDALPASPGTVASAVEEFDADGSNFDTLVAMIEDYRNDNDPEYTQLVRYTNNPLSGGFSVETPNGAQVEGYNIPGILDVEQGSEQFRPIVHNPPTPAPAQPAPPPIATFQPISTPVASAAGHHTVQEYEVKPIPQKGKANIPEGFVMRMLRAILGGNPDKKHKVNLTV